MSEVRHFARMTRRAPRADVAILLMTFFLTVFADLVVAVNIGVILATLQFLRRMASSVEVSQQSVQQLGTELGQMQFATQRAGLRDPTVPSSFGAVRKFRARLESDPRTTREC